LWGYVQRLTVSNALTLLVDGTEPFRELFSHGSLSVEIYEPDGVDNQTPHDRDEIYVVAAGKGHFDLEGILEPFEAGEVIFVPAGAHHRFVDFSSDFSTWVFFYGPVGGEAP
jgi:mannose-6-phosphate isomerase-like protein (cupin superfamily)